MNALFAFLHHVAAFTLVSALVVQFVQLRGELSLESARRLRVADRIYGAAAGAVLVLGLVRAFAYEKGISYYLHSAPFWGKVALFLIIGCISIYLTVEFSSWKKALDQGVIPVVSKSKLQTMHKVIHFELAGILLLLFCAALMAKGIGYWG